MALTMMQRVGDKWEKNGRILFDRPKPTVGSSAKGRRRSYVKSCGLVGMYKITQRYMQRESHVNILYETEQIFNLCLNLCLCL
jgi:hypothetical protein